MLNLFVFRSCAEWTAAARFCPPRCHHIIWPILRIFADNNSPGARRESAPSKSHRKILNNVKRRSAPGFNEAGAGRQFMNYGARIVRRTDGPRLMALCAPHNAPNAQQIRRTQPIPIARQTIPSSTIRHILLYMIRYDFIFLLGPFFRYV